MLLFAGGGSIAIFSNNERSYGIWGWNGVIGTGVVFFDFTSAIHRDGSLRFSRIDGAGPTGDISKKRELSDSVSSVFDSSVWIRVLDTGRREDGMKRRYWKGSYTIEAAIYIPMILFLLYQSLGIAIDKWQNSRLREAAQTRVEMDIIGEFYGYQILDEIGKEIGND